MGRDAADRLVWSLEQYGFVVAALAEAGPPEAQITALSAVLGLGDPYIPALYRYAEMKEYSASYSNIRSNPQDHHPGFSTTASQGWHVDGLLDKIGEIKTTILYCVRAAQQGGETLLFNSVAAFAELREEDPAAATALLSPDALKRRSTIPAMDMTSTGPAFSVDPDGNYITRYTDNDTCTWNFSADPVGALRAALDFLRAASEDPRYQRSVRLSPGQALIFRNDRMSHGRRSYKDTPGARRHLIRALYVNAPVSPS
ncbi:TfdA family taurine catabolism dioxygenase TauD [Amycolatopsis cihanbeyliensis]|uniref:TfdA family taurine catabolism dioxygenase TauD n=1 Tax=Amycolatopsis cihanbeyliensis TaxID=1128664 RepID=A0A542DEW8_AMYCI|nr:TfdA family taurine catabolism dioxygenase TauD [Amycolatopsis cihanbeyliensis]